MNGNEEIKKYKVRYIMENAYGFVKGNTYDAFEILSALPKKCDIIGVVDCCGEEYAFPREWFEKV